MKNNLEIIREACIAANPAIMELGFGCEVRIIDPRGEYRYWLGKVITHAMGPGHWYCLTSSKDEKKDARIKGFHLEDRKNTVILGRPIRLADVMKAMGKKEDFGYACDSSGQLLVCDLLETNEQWSPKFMFWNLLKDDLREQSEETLDFLAELFK